MKEIIMDQIAATAMEAMLYEVSATPKPGLVDRVNSGAHRDMDYYTFLTSAAALHNSFDEMVRIGWEYRDRPITELLEPLRKCGLTAETRMLAATMGVNTHKGMIFTLGILCGCAGWVCEKESLHEELLCNLAAAMCAGLCERELANRKSGNCLTHGERVYLAYGYKGARGEVESGYQTVRTIALPCYRQLREQGVAVNDALVQTLLHLIAGTADTNIASRHDQETCFYASRCAEEALAGGGIFTEGSNTYLLAMDQDFIQKNISPGGCADLLAVTHFLYTITSSFCQK